MNAIIISPLSRRRAFVTACSKLIPIPDIEAEKMAESKAKIEFDLKLKQSEEIPDKFACFLCKIIPRKAPIYQIVETKMIKDRVHLGKIICVDCTRFGWDFGYVEGYRGMRHERNEILEAMLFVSPPTCKYKKNGCKYVQDLKKLEYEDDIYHERECKFRDVSCPAKDCKKPMPFLNLKYHMESECDGKFFKNGLLRKKVIEMYSAFDVEITNWETYETFVYEDDGYIWYSQMSKEYVYLTGSMQVLLTKVLTFKIPFYIKPFTAAWI